MHEPRIDPDQAPGGLVIRIRRADGTCVCWDAVAGIDRLTDAVLAERTEGHHLTAIANAPCRLEVFDGDSGEINAAFFIVQVDA